MRLLTFIPKTIVAKPYIEFTYAVIHMALN